MIKFKLPGIVKVQSVMVCEKVRVVGDLKGMSANNEPRGQMRLILEKTLREGLKHHQGFIHKRCKMSCQANSSLIGAASEVQTFFSFLFVQTLLSLLYSQVALYVVAFSLFLTHLVNYGIVTTLG